jgi:hypothetical protein
MKFSLSFKKTSSGNKAIFLSALFTLVVVLEDNKWLWAQKAGLPSLQLFLPQIMDFPGISASFQTQHWNFPGNGDGLQVSLKTGPITISNKGIKLSQVQLHLKAAAWSLKHELFELKCRDLVAHVQVPEMTLDIPTQESFTISSSASGVFTILEGEKLASHLATIFVEQFLGKLADSTKVPGNFSFDGHCPGRARSLLRSAIVAHLQGSHLHSDKELKSSLVQKTKTAIQERFQSGISSHSIKNLHSLFEIESLVIPLIFSGDTERLWVSTPNLGETLWVANRLAQRETVSDQFEVYIPTETLDFLSEALWKMASKRLAPSNSVRFDQDGNLTQKISAGWKVESLKPFNPLFQEWDNNLCLDVEFVTQYRSSTKKSPRIRPYKAQGGFKSGIEFEVPLTVRYLDSKTGLALAEQGIGILSTSFAIEKDFRSPNHYLRIAKAEILRETKSPQGAELGPSDIPPSWVDTLEFLLNEHTRRELLSKKINSAVQESKLDNLELLERIEFLVQPTEDLRRKKEKSSYYASGILVKL